MTLDVASSPMPSELPVWMKGLRARIDGFIGNPWGGVWKALWMGSDQEPLAVTDNIDFLMGCDPDLNTRYGRPDQPTKAAWRFSQDDQGVVTLHD